MKRALMFQTLVVLPFLLLMSTSTLAQGIAIPTDDSQSDFLKAYKFVLSKSSSDHRFTNSTMDTTLFPRWGESSVYWAKSGPHKGSFIFPDVLSSSYSAVSSTSYSNYDWKSEDHYAISFKAYSKAIAIFKSGIRAENNSISWEAVYFKNLVESFLLPKTSYYISEEEINASGINWSTQILIFPSLAVYGNDWKFYIDSMFTAAPRLEERLMSFLARGGTIYTEGNAVYMIEKLGLLSENAVNFHDAVIADPATGSIQLKIPESGHPMSFTQHAAGTTVYASTIPNIETGDAEIIAREEGSDIPVVFALTGSDANNGKIVCNTALPTVGGSDALMPGTATPDSRQLQWALNAIMYAFATNVDVTRSVYNEMPDTLSVGRNAASFDRCDTLEIRVKLRNLSSHTVDGIEVKESIRSFFGYVDVQTSGVTHEFKKPYLTLSDISLSPHSEKVIVYRIATPDPEDAIHEQVAKYISWASYIYASYSIVSYTDNDVSTSFRKYRNYVDMMFSARIVADTDLNWKNFLGLYYQPFKVFMMMENKERTSAVDSRYVQYIPKDVPFYWSDKTIDIPILKTPGGKYVDVLRGSNDEGAPDYDMDSDGHPDVWLDTASIYPKNYQIEETSVYWLNPWEHLRSGNTTYYEDIDHDGLRAQDTNGDGIVDIEEPGDKIRVWKVTWDLGTVKGYQFFDPFCHYEIWVDPPDLVPMSAGIGHAHGKLDENVNGMFYPYSPDIDTPDMSDTSWTHWMERDKDGNVIWKQLIFQSIQNYEGFTFIDTLASGYKLRGTDRSAGSVPQPHREFIAVLSLGGEEIDMNNPTPEKSQYSNLEYSTIFGEERNTPIRTTYTYYAPLPNPLQFEYITNNFTITDPSDQSVLQFLPAYGKANLTFDIDASTEYTYYWIRNVGHDVDFNDPSLAQEGVDELGDGVFGYMIYDIPKGMGGYKITLPKTPDGEYDINRIVQVDGQPYKPWLSNPNTENDIRILEDPFQYHVFIPQLLIPPALDDDNFDGIDDWIDDRGDRFQSNTGFLHDAFMLGNGEQYLNYPAEPFKDDIYGWVSEGWYGGEDNTYGDDFFENLGKTHFTIHALYEGSGREGSVDISKGGWLVVEEIFGGSPWVLFSHALSAYSEGVNYSLSSYANPTAARFGVDTVFVKHIIQDKDEPHEFDANFDPYTLSYGYGLATITTFSGGKDPGGFISPSSNMPTIIDPAHDHKEITILQNADPSNPDLKDYPKTLEGTFIQVLIEVSNGSDYNWVTTSVTPTIPPELGETELVMSYVSYPRPLVPAKVDPATGAVIQGGDDPGSFKTGWRFNQPEGEVLVKMGNTINLMQPSRRAYFVFLFSIDESLPEGIFDIDFKISGDMRRYDGTFMDEVGFDVPPSKFSISKRDGNGNVLEYQKLVLGQGTLNDIKTSMVTPAFTGLENVRWSDKSINYTDFDSLKNTLPASYDPGTGIETIDLRPLGKFPTVDLSKVYLLEQGQVQSTTSNETLYITTDEELNYEYEFSGSGSKSYRYLYISTVGPSIILDKSIVSVNGQSYDGEVIPSFAAGEVKDIEVLFELTNRGTTLAENVVLNVKPGLYFYPDADMLPQNCILEDGTLEASCSSILPGETREVYVRYSASDAACATVYDSSSIVNSMTAMFNSTYSLSGNHYKEGFKVPDQGELELPAYDFQSESLVASREKAIPGQKIELTARIVNGVVAAEEITVAFYAIENYGDTLLIGTQTLSGPMENSVSFVSTEAVVPKTAQHMEFLVMIDPGNSYGEFCEFNNITSLTVPLCVSEWILDVNNYPNPVQSSTLFSYTLPRHMSTLDLTIHNLNGRELLRINNVPSSIGRQSVLWSDVTLPPGVYMYRFSGKDESGASESFSGKLIKVW
jgi:hypothetical protein